MSGCWEGSDEGAMIYVKHGGFVWLLPSSHGLQTSVLTGASFGVGEVEPCCLNRRAMLRFRDN